MSDATIKKDDSLEEAVQKAKDRTAILEAYKLLSECDGAKGNGSLGEARDMLEDRVDYHYSELVK